MGGKVNGPCIGRLRFSRVGERKRSHLLSRPFGRVLAGAGDRAGCGRGGWALSPCLGSRGPSCPLPPSSSPSLCFPGGLAGAGAAPGGRGSPRQHGQPPAAPAPLPRRGPSPRSRERALRGGCRGRYRRSPGADRRPRRLLSGAGGRGPGLGGRRSRTGTASRGAPGPRQRAVRSAGRVNRWPAGTRGSLQSSG